MARSPTGTHYVRTRKKCFCSPEDDNKTPKNEFRCFVNQINGTVGVASTQVSKRKGKNSLGGDFCKAPVLHINNDNFEENNHIQHTNSCWCYLCETVIREVREKKQTRRNQTWRKHECQTNYQGMFQKKKGVYRQTSSWETRKSLWEKKKKKSVFKT